MRHIIIATMMLALLMAALPAQAGSVSEYLARNTFAALRNGNRNTAIKSAWQFSYTLSFARYLYKKCPQAKPAKMSAIEDMLVWLATGSRSKNRTSYRLGMQIGEIDAGTLLKIHDCDSVELLVVARGLKKIFFDKWPDRKLKWNKKLKGIIEA